MKLGVDCNKKCLDFACAHSVPVLREIFVCPDGRIFGSMKLIKVTL
jgi:hypothetical protein